MLRHLSSILLLLSAGTLLAQEKVSPPAESALSEARTLELDRSLRKSLDETNTLVKTMPESINAYSRRGDAYFFLGQFNEAVADYEKMLELDESLSDSHWRRGIALFYAERYKDAAAQFERYHSFDQVDRENGIWRYLSQHRAFGQKVAREGLQKYKKDDREPFPSVYKLFAGTLTPDQILTEISNADLSNQDREMRLFYANLYIGLNHSVESDDDRAHHHLVLATRNPWGPIGGYGPTYMWHVGRLHEMILRKKKAAKGGSPGAPTP